ncbi:MAG: helix-turn-helix transcriptional regulator [Blautia massiliensis (ex Durand et al. 2017)]|nr:AraC family transcriptional regulator [uncultured Subdoligranulum sp.]PWM55925.1 MAG: hypothetical protein DBX91_15590 [Subdoligranulum variabile]
MGLPFPCRSVCRNNPQYFSQLFKKVTGLTPSDYLHGQA